MITRATAMEEAAVLAGAFAWSPDSARLAVLDQVDGALEVRVWDVVGAPREVDRMSLKDSPGMARNRLMFTPSGTRLVLTGRP